jgi:cyclopropane fatty-acyl-phospholipid synthase-like methyltransferase
LEKYFDSVTGVDLAPNTIEVAKKRLPNCRFIVDDITSLSQLPSDINYSHIISYGVLHYISRETIDDFFKTLARITKPGCRIVICRVPNHAYYEAYQEFRQKRALSRQLIVKDQLQWNWFSEEFLRSQVEAHFEFIPFLPLLQLEFPLRAFFDFVLIRK